MVVSNTTCLTVIVRIPPPPPPPNDEPPQVVPDVGLGISPSLHARYDKIVAEKKSPQAPPTARINRPGIGADKQRYQRAKSARVLPTAPPPPPPPSTSFGNKSIAALGGGHQGLSMSLHAPAASRRAASSRTLGRASPGSMLGKAASVRGVVPPPPPPPTTPPPPLESPQPEDLLLAEGVPLAPTKPETPSTGGLTDDPLSSPPVPAPEKTKKSKKTKKKEEAQPEVFEDEMEEQSVSEAEEELSAEEKAEQKEKEVRKTLFWAVLNACGLIFLITLISKLCQRFSDADYAGEDEFLNAAGTNVAGPVPPPAGVETAVNMGVAQNMAVVASQGAAASTAAGTTSAVAVAATATAAVTSVTSTASVVGVSAVAVTGVGMATGVVPVPSLPWASNHPCHAFLEELSPRRGHVNLHIKNLPPNFFNVPANTPAIEMAFTEAFNKVLGTCVADNIEDHNGTDTNVTGAFEIPQDAYARFLLNATLDAWDFWSVRDSETGKPVKYFTTEWVAFVGCHDQGSESVGCSELEPLFYDGDMKTSRGGSPEEQGDNMTERYLSGTRWLQDAFENGEPQGNLELFMESFALELQELMTLIPNGKGMEPDVFFGASLAANDIHTIVETDGVKYQNGKLLAGKGSGGTVDTPHGLPICSLPNGNPIPTLELKQGYVHVRLEGVEGNFFDTEEQLLRDAFRSVYNDLMLGCEGDYSRVLEKVELDGKSEWTEQGQLMLSTNWTCIVSCDGCPDIEPLFLVGDAKGKPSTSAARGGRQLEIMSQTKLARFANAFAAEVSKLYQTPKPGAIVQAYYAASLDAHGAVVGNAVGEIKPFSSKHDELVDCSTMQPPDDVDDLEEGRFQLYIKDLVKDMNKDILGATMRDVYNEVTGMCDGPLQRVAHRITVDEVEQVVIDDMEIYVALNMTAKLTCTYCDDLDEMMFGGGEQGVDGRMLQDSAVVLFERFQSKLTTQINLLLTDFEQTPYFEKGVPLFESTDPQSPHKQVSVVYGATVDRSGKVTQYGTPVHNHNIFAATEELRAGPDVIVAVATCERDLVAADGDRDHGLTKDEFFVFVRSLFPAVAPLQSWPSELGGYVNLGVEVQETFDKFQKGGVVEFGGKDGADNAKEKKRTIRVEAICYFTSHAIRDSMVSNPVPTSPAPSTSPTERPTTGSPTTRIPTMAPTSEFPSSAPSASPTETRVVVINVEWRFKMEADNGNATEEEYRGFTDLASAWISEIMQETYASNSTFNFESQVTTFMTGRYNGTNTDYSIVAITKSDFIFRGEQPTSRSVFAVLDQLDKEVVKKFVEEELWVPSSEPNPWIFDSTVGLTIATALDTR